MMELPMASFHSNLDPTVLLKQGDELANFHSVILLAAPQTCLTTLLSGRTRRPFRAAERAIHCDDGAATMIAGPLQHVVRCHALTTVFAESFIPGL